MAWHRYHCYIYEALLGYIGYVAAQNVLCVAWRYDGGYHGIICI